MDKFKSADELNDFLERTFKPQQDQNAAKVELPQ